MHTLFQNKYLKNNESFWVFTFTVVWLRAFILECGSVSLLKRTPMFRDNIVASS